MPRCVQYPSLFLLIVCPSFFFFTYRLTAKWKYYRMDVNIVKLTRAVVELPQLPLLLCWNSRTEELCGGLCCCCCCSSSCAGWRNSLLRFIAPDSSVHLSSFKHDFFECTPWQCGRIYSHDLPIWLYSTHVVITRKFWLFPEPRRASALRGEAPLANLIRITIGWVGVTCQLLVTNRQLNRKRAHYKQLLRLDVKHESNFGPWRIRPLLFATYSWI